MAKTKSSILKVNKRIRKPLRKLPVEKKTLSLLLDGGYQDKVAEEKLQKKGYKKVEKFTNDNHTVYLNDNKEPIIVHRGTQNVADIVTDGMLFLGLEKYHPRFREAQRLTKKVRAEFDQPVTVIGHSLGGSLAEFSGGDEIVTVNKGVGLSGLGKIIPAKQYDVRRRGDMVSVLSNLQVSENKIQESMNSVNPLVLHTYTTLLDD
jgi:hypothetical protein